MSKPTIKDVAHAAGVSTATVSRVLHENGYVSDEARKLVEQALEKTGFRLNLVAQSLRRQHSRIIGHLLTNLVPNPYFASVEAGVEEIAVKNGYSVLVWNTLANADREREGVEAFIDRRIDAMIFTTPRNVKNVQAAKQAGIQVVQIEKPVYTSSHLVMVDNYSGAASAMEHLIALGHRRIAFVGRVTPPNLQKNYEADQQRFKGYQDVMRNHDLIPDERWVCLNVDPYSVADGYRFASTILAQTPRVTAILAGCDILAAGVLQAAYELGVQVPQDLSVIGFDNTFAPFLTPPLTTVDLPALEMGRTAARLAITALESESNRETNLRTETLKAELIVRKSTARLSG
ncbi:MAG: LacI family DNA-binding transcriptional regulator [Chloroflexi bacterium]|nr:LacI family DNA-binding transcriptional regulator [Chloroflexota bacterium]